MKWVIAVDALSTLTTTYEGRIRFGLILFPDTQQPACEQTEVPVLIGESGGTQMRQLLSASLARSDAYYPDGPCVTNIDTAMEQASRVATLFEEGRDSYVVLITDGYQANCPNAGGDALTLQVITQLRERGVPTFVVGFGGAVKPASLISFADAGGVPSGDPVTKYYKAEDQPSLDQVLATIGSKTLSCNFVLAEEPEDPEKIYVFFDGEEVARDTSRRNGWDYDAASRQITFYGASCAQLKGGEVGEVSVAYGCKEGPPPT